MASKAFIRIVDALPLEDAAGVSVDLEVTYIRDPREKEDWTVINFGAAVVVGDLNLWRTTIHDAVSAELKKMGEGNEDVALVDVIGI